MTIPMYILLLLAIILANLPFFSSRLLFIFPLHHKHFGYYFFEWVVYFGLTGIFAYLLEQRMNSVQQQDWSFYVIVVCLFAVFAFPGFVWRYFWRHSKKSTH